MSWWTKSRPNKNSLRKLKQAVQSEFEFREYGVKKLRHKGYYDSVLDTIWYDLPKRTLQRSWKEHRNRQYKEYDTTKKRFT